MVDVFHTRLCKSKLYPLQPMTNVPLHFPIPALLSGLPTYRWVDLKVLEVVLAGRG
jgi:hypothetical protein